MLQLRQPASRGKGMVVHIPSSPKLMSTLCGTMVGRTWTVCLDTTTCPKCKAVQENIEAI